MVTNKGSKKEKDFVEKVDMEDQEVEQKISLL
jgi:hypothetical protein